MAAFKENRTYELCPHSQFSGTAGHLGTGKVINLVREKAEQTLRVHGGAESKDWCWVIIRGSWACLLYTSDAADDWLVV